MLFEKKINRPDNIWISRIAWIALVSMLGILTVVSGVFQDFLKNKWATELQFLSAQNSGWIMIGILLLLGLIVGATTWLIDKLKPK